MLSSTIAERLAEAEQDLARAEARARRTVEHDPLTVAREHLTELPARQAEIDAARAARPATEKPPRPASGQRRRNLQGSRAGAHHGHRGGRTGADRARRRRPRPHRHGGPRVGRAARGGLDTVTVDGTHDVGGTVEGNARVRGAWWTSAAPDALLMHSVSRVAVHTHRPTSDLARRVNRYRGVPELEMRTDRLVADLPPLAPYVDQATVAMAAKLGRMNRERREAMAATHVISDHARELAERTASSPSRRRPHARRRAFATTGRPALSWSPSAVRSTCAPWRPRTTSPGARSASPGPAAPRTADPAPPAAPATRSAFRSPRKRAP
jgi:hypothetical protein